MQALLVLTFKRITVLAVCLWLAAAPSSDLSAQSSNLTQKERGLWRFLRHYVEGPDPRHEDTRIAVAFVDLNGNQRDEALVYVMGRRWCGSGGCNLWIMQRENSNWQIITNVTVARRPIRVLNRRNNGWNDVGVFVNGGGVIHGYEAALRYERGAYPSNPSLVTADPRSARLRGTTVIGADNHGRPLFP